MTAPSLFLFITPFIVASLFPACTTSLSINTVSPTGIGLIYVTFKVRLTPAKAQYPGLAMGASAQVVVKSKIVEQQPPWRWPARLLCSGWIVNENRVFPAGLEEADTR